MRAKPSAAKGRYIQTITLTTTMGPGVHVDPTRTRDIVEELEEDSRPQPSLGFTDAPFAEDSWQPLARTGRSPAEAALRKADSLSVGPPLAGSSFPEEMTMHKTEKEQVVAELTERLRTSDTLIVADYRGLTIQRDRRAAHEAPRARRPASRSSRTR